jgi:hypothetical protein
MVGMNVVWRSPDLGEVTTTTNFYGEAQIRFVPKTPGAAQLTATVGDAQYSESISLPYFLHEPRQIKELVSDDPSGYPGQEASARVYVVSAITGNPWQTLRSVGNSLESTSRRRQRIARVSQMSCSDFRLFNPVFSMQPFAGAWLDGRSVRFFLRSKRMSE